MKNKISIVLVVALATLLAIQCKKKKDEPDPTPEPEPTTSPISTLSDLFALNGSPTQTVEVSATTASTVNIGGIDIEVPANAFLTQSNGTITGNVVLAVKTILTKAQIILSGAPANSANSRLVSTKGCVKISPSQNSQSLRLNTSGGDTVFVNITDGIATPTPMKKFYASKLSVTDSTKVWVMENDTNDINVIYQAPNYVHRAALDSAKWLNIGTLQSDPAPKVSMIIRPDTTGAFNSSNCAVYIAFDGSLTVGACYQISPTNFRISNIPSGKNIHIVGIGVINGQYYSSVSATATSSGTLTLNMQPKTMTQIVTELNTLP